MTEIDLGPCILGWDKEGKNSNYDEQFEEEKFKYHQSINEPLDMES